jgi:hypothetical protein
MGREYSTHGEKRNAYGIFVVNQKEREVGRRMILKWNLER